MHTKFFAWTSRILVILVGMFALTSVYTLMPSHALFDDPLESVSITDPNPGTVVGVITFIVTTQGDADSVTLSILGPDGSSENVTMVHQVGLGQWRLMWPTIGLEDGPYLVTAQATDGENFVQSVPMSIYVDNVEDFVLTPASTTIDTLGVVSLTPDPTITLTSCTSNDVLIATAVSYGSSCEVTGVSEGVVTISATSIDSESTSVVTVNAIEEPLEEEDEVEDNVEEDSNEENDQEGEEESDNASGGENNANNSNENGNNGNGNGNGNGNSGGGGNDGPGPQGGGPHIPIVNDDSEDVSDDVDEIFRDELEDVVEENQNGNGNGNGSQSENGNGNNGNGNSSEGGNEIDEIDSNAENLRDVIENVTSDEEQDESEIDNNKNNGQGNGVQGNNGNNGNGNNQNGSSGGNTELASGPDSVTEETSNDALAITPTTTIVAISADSVPEVAQEDRSDLDRVIETLINSRDTTLSDSDVRTLRDELPIRGSATAGVTLLPSFGESGSSGVLVLDRNEDGVVDDVAERYGTSDLSQLIALDLAPVDRAIVSGSQLQQPVDGGIEDSNYRVEVSVSEVEATIISGYADPNSVVTIFIYSYVPLVLTVATDSAGYFEYTLEEQLTGEEHESFVVLHDANGEVTKKSSAFSFIVEEAQAAEPMVESEVEEEGAFTNIPESRSQNGSSKAFVIAGIIIVLGAVILLVGVRNARRH